MARTKSAKATAAEAAPSIPEEPAPPPAATPATAAEMLDLPRPQLEAGKPQTVAGEERRPWPDVSEQKVVKVSRDGDMLRLLRSHKYNQMQIKGDGELPDWAKERLKADGWRDRVEDEGIYTKQLPPRAKPGEENPELSSARRRMDFEAERFFEQLANDLRADRQMPPVRLGGAAVAER
jgi:hypothetical protein